jgi:O-antigen/teichoic acid export membrane protein
VQVLVFFAMPLVVFLFVAAEELVLLVLGPAWTAVVPLYRVLAPAALMSTFNVATGWVYLSWGHTRRQFQWVVFASTVQMAAFFVGVSWGTLGVAAAFSVAVVALRLPGVAFCFRTTPLRMGSFLVVIGRPAAAAVAAGAIAWVARAVIAPAAPLVARLALDAAVFLLAYAAAWWFIPGGRAVLRDIVALWPVITGGEKAERADA